MEWLDTDWRLLMPSTWAHLALALVAILCGAIIGSEREKREKPAGIRTLILVCLGSTTFTMVSFAFGTTTGDTGRVAAQIVTGIGFLGGGVILHGRTEVSGITTAATVWATAAMGVVIGVGQVGAGLGLSFLIRGVLTGVYWLEHRESSDLPSVQVEMLVEPDGGKALIRIERLLDEFRLANTLKLLPAERGDFLRLECKVQLSRRHRLDLLNQLAEMQEVRELRQYPDPFVTTR